MKTNKHLPRFSSHAGTLYGQSQIDKAGLKTVPSAQGITYKIPEIKLQLE